MCTNTIAPVAEPVSPQFSPQTKEDLESAIDEYLELSPQDDDGSTGPHGPIGEWDVSRITDMSDIFGGADQFNGDISKWDVSRVTDMRSMFADAALFNADVSKWKVKRVTNMNGMFTFATSFNGDISKWDK